LVVLRLVYDSYIPWQESYGNMRFSAGSKLKFQNKTLV
jgi:hypothetical protein